MILPFMNPPVNDTTLTPLTLIETIHPVPPFDYGDTVCWRAENGEVQIVSIVGFERSGASNTDFASALIELQSGEMLRVPVSALMRT
jgi:hypothetical protein